MIINENELRKIVVESVKRNLLSEAPSSNNSSPKQNNSQGQNSSTEFSDDYVNKNIKNRPANALGQSVRGAGAGVGAYVGGQAAGGLLGGMLGASSETAGEFGNVLSILGLGAVAAKVIGGLTALTRVKKLKFPRSPMNAMEYAKYAAAQRAMAQDSCKKLQKNIHNAIVGFNKAFPKNQIDSMELNQGMQQATYQDRGQQKNVDVDFDKDFNNINAGQNESRRNKKTISEALDSSQQQQIKQLSEIKTPAEFFNVFSNSNIDDAKNQIDALKEAYRLAYGEWMEWTRYINVLVHKFEKYGMTWDMVIKSNMQSKPMSIISAFAKKYFNIPETNNINDYQGKNETTEATLRVKSLDYPINQGQKVIKYILFRDEKNGNYYAIKKNGGKTKMVDANGNSIPFVNGMPVTASISPNLISGQKLSSNGYKINILVDGTINRIRPIMDNSGNVVEI